ncbi:hypothetical protein WR25_25422 [Diploscapter pachys]|uniref:PH domain-containing protein n=1 Tax=Diploscapter pachys TaxID=2018661 RepID=A0A2A2JGG2_9BILA|nr:hypothetical protein WR25_25422 [Diploscapter pachys]
MSTGVQDMFSLEILILIPYSLWYRGTKCGKCKRKLCKKCFGRYRTENKHSRICEMCVKNMFRGSLGKTFDRYFVVRNDFCLYSYNSPQDECALAMLPLPGCEVKMCGEKYTFSVRVGSRRMYTITAEDETSQARWMAVLDLAANAQINGGNSPN